MINNDHFHNKKLEKIDFFQFSADFHNYTVTIMDSNKF